MPALIRTAIAALPLLAMLAGCATEGKVQPRSAPPPAAAPQPAIAETRILDRTAADHLLRNSGVTLQWIDWNTRGIANVRKDAGLIRLTASQISAEGPGRLWLDGKVTEIGADYFIFSGTIRITDAPDKGRTCEASRDDWRFAVTQGRPYWRLRTFEWCDGLTDYIDIYKPAS